VAEIDLHALRRNADVLRAAIEKVDAASEPRVLDAGGAEGGGSRVRFAGVGILAVLKADAYGHGAAMCAQALSRKVWGFAVSLVEEGVELRRAGIDLPIVVLGCHYGLSHRDVVAYRLTPVVADAGDLGRFERAVEELGAPRLSIHVKIDTGMSRLGVRPEKLDDFVAALKDTGGVTLSGLCTHLAEADGPASAPTEQQLQQFALCRARLLAAGLYPGVVHVANTAGAVRFHDARFDLVRPGIGLFGVAPSHTPLTGLWPVMTWKTRIIALREVPAATGVSYGGATRTYTQGPTRIATLPVGYADGYTRRMSGQAQVLCAGRRCPVLGPITMDMTMVDVTAVPDDLAKLGEEVVLLGQQAGADQVSHAPITLEEMAGWAGTIPWEVCCAISKRVPRIYLGDLRR
jgi:alanine racemase